MRLENQLRPSPSLLAKAMTGLGFLVLYVPLVTLVCYSFLKQGPVFGSPKEWTLEWYGKLFSNDAIIEAFKISVYVAAWNMVGSTLLGTAAALSLTRSRFPGRKVFDAITYIPLIMPEIVLGLSLLIWFVLLRITLGVYSIIIAHITFSVSYVIITVKSRLQGFDDALEEAARDLGATPLQTLWHVTLPLIWPSILSGALMAFALSFDDFLITFFTTGVGSDTLPLKIYSMIKFGVTPEINALSTIVLLGTFVLVFYFYERD
jgi:spermidine/putrescine transport system permease protein